MVISVPQSDLTLISGTLYEMDTETDFRQAINAIMASQEGIVFDDPISHNGEVTVAGTTFARTIEVLSPYSVTFTPDSQWTVRLAGSNNNIFDVENGILNQNQVQVIAQNSAGLVVTDSGAGDWTTAEKEQIRDALGIGGTKTAATGGQLQDIPDDVWDLLGKIDGKTPKESLQIIAAAVAGLIEDAGGGKINFKGLDKSTLRITMALADANGNRSEVTYS